MTKPNQYKIIDPDTGELLFNGNTKECAEFMGITMKAFQNGTYAMRKSNKEIWRGYCIEVVKTECKQREQPVKVKSAIKAWNDFTEPLRKAYGIPVYRSNGEVEKDA